LHAVRGFFIAKCHVDRETDHHHRSGRDGNQNPDDYHGVEGERGTPIEQVTRTIRGRGSERVSINTN